MGKVGGALGVTECKDLLQIFILLFFSTVLPIGYYGKKESDPISVFFLLKKPIQKLNYKKNQKKKKEEENLHYISWPPTTLKVFWSSSLWLLIRSFKHNLNNIRLVSEWV